MFLVFSLGIALWLAYGLMVSDGPLIVANAVTLVLALAILGLKIRHG
jgi:MtN3 and saliva related transmembrane protein